MWKAASRCIFRRAPLALLALGAFAVTLQAPAGDAASKKLPSGTSSITVTQATETSLSISWQRVRSAAGYDLYLNQTRVATTQTTAYTLGSLRCGSSFQVGVDSFNARGVRSSIVSVAGRTRACSGSPVGNDTSPPTPPVSLIQGATTATSISLLWAASQDNVGVAGYELFVNGNKVGTTTATSYTFPNLSCGTSYTLAVDAFDAAGNRSQRISVNGTTSACAGAAPTPPPPNKCTATLAAGGNAVSFFNSLSPGDVGCLHGGTYGGASIYSDFSKSGTSSAPITLQSYPGETATLRGYNAIGGSYVTFTNLKIDNTNTFTGSSECGGRYESFTLAGSNIVLDHNEITASDISHSSNGVYVTGSNEEIRFNKIHGVGACQNFDHGIYVGHGAGTQIRGNWIWNIPHGWGVQVYPSSSGVHAYSNVIDRAQNGFVLCSTGSNNLIEHNVVANSIGGPGALTSGCGPQAPSTGNVVSNNDQWNNPGGLGNVSGITYGGNISADPGFVDSASHDYETLSTSPLLSWSIWNGS
jgi:hypothetical protein